MMTSHVLQQELGLSSVQVILNVSEQAYELESGYVDEVGTFLED